MAAMNACRATGDLWRDGLCVSRGEPTFFQGPFADPEEARQACLDDNKDVIRITDDELNTQVMELLSSIGGSVLVGGSDSNAEGAWEFDDGTPMTYFNWAGGEPNSWGDEDCIQMYPENGLWNDRSCTGYEGVVCY
eukprot:SAG11_NODE_847_length_6882_cov_3.352204_8_plen_136_part_00